MKTVTLEVTDLQSICLGKFRMADHACLAGLGREVWTGTMPVLPIDPDQGRDRRRVSGCRP
ncbi:hypothetical protein [Aminobacter ciceronei]|uniref:Uncharacterized protein n=1 Tax=Aminobacter ciceronei TaxID=150723 RepID=A0ABR6C2I7_9HYPH|nr:hypothetical protein [Aminobacter ciceronei]MBA8905565.1 hypothetical protein [Aminobacter ciceronei]MBA9019136.1 hypothetical protein [Aminobacter ciceronei]